MNKHNIGVIDARNIIKSIKSTHNYDFTDYGLSSFIRRLSKIMEDNNITDTDILLDRIKNDSGFFELFLLGVSVEATEAFRDPSMWRIVRDNIIAKLTANNRKARIWIPFCSSGEELYTLLILLHEAGISDKFSVLASCLSNYNIEKIKKGIFNPKKIEIDEDNYQRFNGNAKLSNYYKYSGELAYWDINLLNGVTFSKTNILFDNSPVELDMILFRNQMLYYNPKLQGKILLIMSKNLKRGGYFIIGSKESFANFSINKEFMAVSYTEKIFRKK